MAEELSKNEQLKAENDFIKMKLMLERGAEFSKGGTEEELPPELENQFLKNVMAFEKQYDTMKTIKVFDKLEKPGQFKPVGEIPDTEIDKAWKELKNYMARYEVYLDACSPNVSARELYRFTIEELFNYEMDDMDLPGLSTCFIYDEFYPDPVYESKKTVIEDLLPGLFTKEPVNEYFLCLHTSDILVNGKLYAESKDVKDAFRHFKSLFSSLRLQQTTVDQCSVTDKSRVTVSGSYKAVAKPVDREEEILLNGSFLAELQPDELGYWSIKRLDIEAIGLSN